MMGKALADAAWDCGVEPIAVLAPQPRPGLVVPPLVLQHAPAPPESRAALFGSLQRVAGKESAAPLALSPREWEILLAGEGGLWGPGADVLWGTPLPLRSEGIDPRRLTLRAAAALIWDRLPRSLWRPVASSSLALESAALRTLLAPVSEPFRFPPIVSAEASPVDREAAVLGMVHVAFGAHPPSQGETGPQAWPQAEAAQRGAAAGIRSLEGWQADLPKRLPPWAQSLALVPGPWGSRRAFRILAVVDDEAPLREAALWAEHLRQLLGALDTRAASGVFGGSPRLLLLTEAALRGLLGSGLFAEPLQGAAMVLHSLPLAGRPLLGGGLAAATPLPSADDRVVEASALVMGTAGAWSSGATTLCVSDLLYGRWPALLDLCRGGGMQRSLAFVHEDLARRIDPAESRVGSTALRSPWWDSAEVDLGRPSALLRNWGPTLIRLQEACVEALS